MRRFLIPAAMVLACAATARSADGPAPVNPYHGIQDRADVFQFAEKPKVVKQGDKWIVTFATTDACDATVSVVDADGRIVRHLASGVLGKNAPYPFQQDSLSQKLQWDGQDDQGKPTAAGCKVRVGLGLGARFDRNLLGSPYDIAPEGEDRRAGLWTATDAEGRNYVVDTGVKSGATLGRVFDKDGAYVRTFWPPAAADLEKWLDLIQTSYQGKKGVKMAPTIWGDKVPVTGVAGICMMDIEGLVTRAGGGKPAKGSAMAAVAARRPPTPKLRKGSADHSLWTIVMGKSPRLAADRRREELYVGSNGGSLYRLDARTGELDPSWDTIRGGAGGLSDCCVGPDDLLYTRLGSFGYGQYIVRFDHAGVPVDFGGDAVVYPAGRKQADVNPLPCWELPGNKAMRGRDVKVLWTGLVAHSNIHERGLYVSPRGYIVAQMASVDKDYAAKHGLDFDAKYPGLAEVWSPEGKLLTANAVGRTWNGHGVAMDRDGNIYSTTGSLILPAGQKALDGIADGTGGYRVWGGHGTLLKYRGLGDGNYPLNVGEGTVQLGRGDGTPRPGALWGYGGIVCQSNDCTCHNVRYDMDYFARHWLPANQLGSVMVLDANGNRLARLGRYGNVDDTAADVKAGRNGLRFVWAKAVAVSDTALYVADGGSRRLLKAALLYAAEETVPLP